jgi:hypothetical protein
MRTTFVAPETTLGTLGQHVMTYGRRTYAWSTIPMWAVPISRERSGEGRPSHPIGSGLVEPEAAPTAPVRKRKRARRKPAPVAMTLVPSTVAPAPKVERRRAPSKREIFDSQLRAEFGFAADREVTPAMRRAYRDLLALRAQRNDYTRKVA